MFGGMRRGLTDRLIALLSATFDALGSWHRPAAVRFAQTAVPLVHGAQNALAGLTSNYVAQAASEALARPVAPPPIPPARRGARLRLKDPQEVYQRPFTQAWGDLAKGEPLDQAVRGARVRLREIAEGDMQQTYAEAAQEAMQALPPADRPVGWRRVLVGPENCAMCVVASTQLYTLEHLNPIHPACVPGIAPVDVRNILAGTRRRYTGELAVIATSAGNQIAVTPNHPILTDVGWLPAGEIGPVHYVADCCQPQRVVGSGPNESQRPVVAQDVWRALAVTFGFIQMPLTAEDFHGDGSDGQVDIIRADGYFTPPRYVKSVQAVDEFQFVSGQRRGLFLTGFGDAAPFVPRGFTSTGSGVRGGYLRGALFGGHLCSPHATGVRGATALDTCLNQPPANYGACDPLLVRDDVLSEAPGVVGGQRFHRVIDVSRVNFTGHVYNFQTATGTYGAYHTVTHNCDCTVAPVFGDAEHVIEPELLEKVHAAVFQLTGRVDRGARAPDYRKIITRMTYVHGELGPMLARPKDHHTGPNEIPDVRPR